MTDAGNGRDPALELGKTVRRFLDGEVEHQLLLTKFGLLMKFRTDGYEDREKLSDAMLDGAVQYMKKFANLAHDYVPDSRKKTANALLSALDSDENAPVLPRRAAGALSELGLEFVRLAEAARDTRDQADMTDFAALCLEHAERARAIIARRDEDVSTKQAITPAKPVVLKHRTDRRPGPGPGP
jgi:hypothetical protein